MNKQYFEKLNTEKLAEFNKQNKLQKVELGLIDDIKSATDKIEKDWKEALSFAVDEAKQLSDKILKSAKPLNEKLVELRTKVNEAEEALKDLGIGNNKEIEQAKKAIKIASGQSKELSAVAGRIKNAY